MSDLLSINQQDRGKISSHSTYSLDSFLQGRVETTGSLQKGKVLVLKEVTIHFYVNTKQRNAQGRMEN